MLSFFRRVALVFLALVFFLLLAASLTLGAIEGKILDEDFYKDQLEENNFYARVYTDVMPEIEAVPDYYGALQLSRQEAEELTAQIFPPEWLQTQVESLLDDLFPWLRSDIDDLDMTIDLRLAKQRAHSAVMAFLDQKIDTLPDCQPGQVPDLPLISQGVLPECIPSGLDRNVIKEQVMSEAMVFVDANIEQGPDTLDLIEEAKSEGETREQFLDDFDSPRQIISRIIDIPQAALYGAMAAVLGIIVLLNLPRLNKILRWVGCTMFFSGLPLVVIFSLVYSMAPSRVTNAITGNVNDVPATINTLLGDLASSGIRDLSMGFIVPAAIIMGLGLLSFVSSFLPWVRKGQGDSQPR
jgi:hypothetical protein